MQIADKLTKIQDAIKHTGSEEMYYKLLEDLGDLKKNHSDYIRPSRSILMRSWNEFQKLTMSFARHYSQHFCARLILAMVHSRGGSGLARSI